MKKTFLYLAPFLFFACSWFNDDDQQLPLPENIQSYIASNYADYSIDESEQESLCDGTDAFEIELENSNDDEIELTFDAEGNFLYSETEIEVSELPEAVVSGINSAYNSPMIKEAERLNMADDSVQYEVEVKNGSTKLEVLVATDGSIICEQEDD